MVHSKTDKSGVKKPTKDYATLRVYFGNKPSLLGRLIKLQVEHPNTSVSGLVVSSVEACIGTIEDAYRDGKRRFQLNGKNVEM